jgi:phosphoglycolate phosphatase-like HAD superfamily hydrolase
MRICFDLDETLCTGYPYSVSEPLPGARDLLLQVKSQGHHIIIQTARGMGRSDGNIGKALAAVAKETLEQLERWGFVYDEIYFGKPAADLYVDDKSLPTINALANHLGMVR